MSVLTKKIRPIIIILIVIGIPRFANSISLRLLKSAILTEDKTTIHMITSLFVSNDGLIYLCDQKDANIKIYNLKGDFLSAWGRKGLGPNEFMKPAICLYDEDKRMLVVDNGKKRFLTIDIKNQIQFEASKEKRFQSSVYCAAWDGDQVLVAGYMVASDGKGCELFTIDMKKNQSICLIPVEKKYGFESYRTFHTAYMNKSEIVTIGLQAYCDWYGPNIYYIWTGNLKVFRMSKKGGNIQYFGKQTADYIKPQPSSKMIAAYNERRINDYVKEWAKLCHVVGLFACKEFTGIFYTITQSKQNDDRKVKLQFYTPEGRFINELIPPGLNSATNRFYLDKNKNFLYMFDFKEDEETNNITYFIHKYKIEM